MERFYTDAQRVLDANAPDAAAVQLRKTLEAAAAHFEIDDGPLVARIEKLIEEGPITRDGSAPVGRGRRPRVWGR